MCRHAPARLQNDEGEGVEGKGGGIDGGERLTALPVLNFFSVAIDPPERFAAFRAELPRTTVSRCEAPLRALLPILVTESHSSDIVKVDV